MAMQAQAEAAAGLWRRIEEVAAGLGPDDWARDTPCPRWDVHDLVAHLSGLQTFMDQTAPQPPVPEGWSPDPELSGLDQWTEAGVVARRDWSPEQLLAELRTAREGHVARLEAADPDGETTGPLGKSTERKLYGVRMFDLWVHLQDLHVALGDKPEWDDASQAAVDGAQHVFAAVPYLGVKKAGLPEGARVRVTLDEPAPFDAVLTVADGRGGWDTEDLDAQDRVRARPAAMTLLLAGRGAPEDLRGQGVLEWEGPLAEGFVRAARVFS